MPTGCRSPFTLRNPASCTTSFACAIDPPGDEENLLREGGVERLTPSLSRGAPVRLNNNTTRGDKTVKRQVAPRPMACTPLVGLPRRNDKCSTPLHHGGVSRSRAAQRVARALSAFFASSVSWPATSLLASSLASRDRNALSESSRSRADPCTSR